MANQLITKEELLIKDKIFTIRNMQVMLDRDLAELYGVETRALKQAVKRNIKRFPADFMFELDDNEITTLVSQSVIPSKKHLGGAKPFVFTEQGVASLSSVLSSQIAIEINITIMRAFVQMRKFISNNALVFDKIDYIEQKLLKHDEKFDKIFKAIESKDIKPKQGIFFDGQICDAYVFISKILKSAKSSIILVDNYIDETVLLQLSSEAKKDIKITILTKDITKKLQLDLKKHNAQYSNIKIVKFTLSHDRFLIIDKKEIYHIGASLKDLGKKWFAFSLLDESSFALMDKIEKVIEA